METIGVIFGGRSAEHDVSIITAHTPIIDTLRALGTYTIVPIYISKDGKWFSDSKMLDIEYFKENLESKLSALKPVRISFEAGFQMISGGLISKRTKIDIVFPAMHGTFGEDGSIQGLLRMLNVPFVGCDLFASAVAMDKVITKQVLAAEGVPIVPYVWFTKSEWEKDAQQLRSKIAALRQPVFVKPVHLGSSIGIGKASSEEELENAVEVALHYDEKVLVEEAVLNLIEVTLPIMGNSDVKTAEVERPLNRSDFFDFSDKYLSGGKKMRQAGVNSRYSEIPADIGGDLTAQVKEMGKRVYRTLGCSGIARVDFLIDSASNSLYVNEVNTLPGSLYHHNWRKAGVSNVELIESLLGFAKERFASQKKIAYTFKSNILKQFGGAKTSKNQ